MKQMIDSVKKIVNSIPIVRSLATKVFTTISARNFSSSEDYWKARYESEGNSGPGSYSKLAEFKAEVINNFVNEKAIASVIEYGCGDGNQLGLANYSQYIGFDVSPTALSQCNKTFVSDRTKSFKLMSDYNGEIAELTLSLDVIYHLVEDDVFESYMHRMFESSTRFVVIFASNKNEQEKIQPPHVRHRKFTQFIDDALSDWKLIKHIPNKYPFTTDEETGSFADFYIFKKE